MVRQTLRCRPVFAILAAGLIVARYEAGSAAAAGAATTAPAAQATGVAGPADPLAPVRAMVAAKQYDGALVRLQKMMALRGHDADGFDRHEVLMLVAEARLQLRRIPDCLYVLDLAAAEAEQANHYPHRAAAFAMATLVRAAPKLVFTPKAGADRAPLDLSDPAARVTAYGRLYEEKRDFCEEQLRTAREYASVQPLLDTAAAFTVCRALEQVTRNTTDGSDALGDRIATWSAPMIAATLTGFGKRIDMIVLDSNVGMKGRKARGPAGLSAANRTELGTIGATCAKVPDAVDALNRAFARPLMTDAMKTKVEAANMATRVDAILKADAAILKNRK